MIAFKEYGDGPVVVLIHGYCETNEIWESHAKELSQYFRVICPDLPGFGESELLDITSIENFASAVNELLVSLEVSYCTMIGHSLGGYVTLAYYEKHPEKINGFGLFHSTAFADTEEKKDSRNKTIDFIERKGVDPFATAFVPPLFYLSNRKKLEHEIIRVTEIARNTNQQAIIETAKAMRDRKDRINVVEKATVPVLYIVGKEDQAVPMEKTLDQCYKAQNSIVQFLSDTGHMGMYERRSETVKSIKAFISLCNE